MLKIFTPVSVNKKRASLLRLSWRDTALANHQGAAIRKGMDDSAASFRRYLLKKESGKAGDRYDIWRKSLDEYPKRNRLQLENDLVPDIELQPMRWFQAALAQLESARAANRLELLQGAGPAIASYLPYPVFAFGVELFLKGMYLCRYPICRRLSQK